MFSFLKRKQVDPRARLLEAIGTYDLPSFPAIVLRVLRTIRSPDGTVGEVGDLIATDPNLSVQVLKMANSASSGAGRSIGNVRHAVAMSGLGAVESLVLAAGVQASLPRGPAEGYDAIRFWRAAARRATTARALANRLHPSGALESFTAALLQDMAVPLLAHRRGSVYGPILEAWHGGEERLEVMERAEFGWTHGDVATWVCNEWQLSERLAAMIGGHHGAGESEECPPAVCLVSHLGETDEAPGIDQLVVVAHARYGLPEDESIAAVNEAFGQADELARLFV